MALDWQQRFEYSRDPILPWVERVTPIEGRRIVEFGCGNGPVTCALAERGATVLALDIDGPAVEDGRRRLAQRGLDNAEFVDGRFEDLLAEVDSRDRFDVFFLFAVLEHMTIDERLATLAVARAAVGQRGFHRRLRVPQPAASLGLPHLGLPFLGILPDELALLYIDRSQRADFKEAIAAALAQGYGEGREQLTRWGRGVSFHEFELAFDDFPANVVACNYEPELLDVREIHREGLLPRPPPEASPAGPSSHVLALLVGSCDCGLGTRVAAVFRAVAIRDDEQPFRRLHGVRHSAPARAAFASPRAVRASRGRTRRRASGPR